MEILCAYPGTFSPPHFGHLDILKKISQIFDKVYVICSVNPDKDGQVIFTPEECKMFWSFYDLPPNVEVFTLEELIQKGTDFRNVLMVRGVRNEDDFEYEKQVMMDNYRQLGIDKFLLIVSEEKYKNASSTLARKLASEGKIELLCELLARPVAEKMIAKFKENK
jgi:pantetheine-phosphate adenylyltransferase